MKDKSHNCSVKANLFQIIHQKKDKLVLYIREIFAAELYITQ